MVMCIGVLVCLSVRS